MGFSYNDLKKMLFMFSPETAHKIAEYALNGAEFVPGLYDKISKECVINDPILEQTIFDKPYRNPVGIGGGFDKNATMIEGLKSLGFGFLEYGTFTPLPQKGNDKPRLFRLVEEESIQNAMGFNNDGADKIEGRLIKAYPNTIPLWANIGKNKITINETAIYDYIKLVNQFNKFCDAFVINISSPNTPNLRALQEVGFVSELFDTLSKLSKKPLILKIDPDLNYDDAVKISTTAVNSGASGVIISNTSVDYSLSKSPNLKNFGGLSGKAITEKSRQMFKVVADELYGKTTLIASGGIDSPEEAYKRIKMGASLVQIYTSFIFKGPTICRDMNLGLKALLRLDGFSHISQAIGADVRK